MTGHKNQAERPIKAAVFAAGLLAIAGALLISSAAVVGAETQRLASCSAKAEAAGLSPGVTVRGLDGADLVDTLGKGEKQLSVYGNGLICAAPVEQQVRVDGEVEPPVTDQTVEAVEIAEPIAEPIVEPIEEPVDSNDAVSRPEVRSRSSLAVAPSTDQYAIEMLRLINVERAEVGLAPLARNRDLDQYAQQWAVEMSNQPLPLDRTRHHSPTFSGSSLSFPEFPSSIAWTYAFENVGRVGSASGDLPSDAIARLFYAGGGAGFTTSPTHYCNIVETAASEVGVGTYVDPTGALWVAQVFWGTQSPAPAPIAECASTVVR